MQTAKFPVDGVDLYRRGFEVALDSISICSLDAVYLDVNDAHCRMLGYSHDEMIGMNVIDTVHPDYKFHLTEVFLPKVRQEGGIRFDSMMICKDGKAIFVEVHGVVFSYAGKPAFLTIVRDLTKRKKAEDALLASENRYRILSENVTDGVMVIRDKKLVFANKVLSSMFGYDRVSDIVGKNVGSFLHTDFQDEIKEEHEAIYYPQTGRSRHSRNQ